MLKSVLEDIKAISRYRVNKDRAVLDKPLSSIRKTTMQVDVDIGCTETFFVYDDRTEGVRCCRRPIDQSALLVLCLSSLSPFEKVRTAWFCLSVGLSGFCCHSPALTVSGSMT